MKYTKDQIDDRLSHRSLKMIGEYSGMRKKTKFLCECSHQWEARLDHVLGGSGCPRCSGRQKLNKSIINERLSKSCDVQMIDEYVDQETEYEFVCGDGHIFISKAPLVMKNKRCPVCNEINEDNNIINKLIVRGIFVVGDIERKTKRTTFGCSEGHTWETKLYHVLGGGGCPECSKKSTPTITSINKILSPREIELVGNYTFTHAKSLFRHLVCENEWTAKVSHVISGTGCPYCAEYGFNPSSPAWEYAFTRDGYLKFGITNDLTRRLNEHRKHGEITVVHERYHEVGQLALDWENNIKRTQGGRYATKEQCPDGWTETLPLHLTETILK